MSVRIEPVSNGNGLGDFLRFPRDVYRNDPHWVAPIESEVRRTLDVRKNPYFRHATLTLFVAYREGRPVGRLAVVLNELHEKKFGLRTAFFGFFEAFDDEEAIRLLFLRAERYGMSRGARRFEGPFNPHHYSEIGLQLDAHGTPPSFFQPYNPSYYNRRLEDLGFRVSAHFMTMKNDRVRDVAQSWALASPGGERNGYSVRSLDPGDLAAELERIREVNNDAFEENWPFLPLSRDEYAFSAKHMNLVTRPDLVKIVEHHGRPVGVLHAVLDVNPLLRSWRGKAGPVKYLRFLAGRRKIRKLLIYTVAVKKAYRRGRATALLHEALRGVVREFEVLETTWISPDNTPVVKAAEGLGLRPDKHFAVYAKEVGR